MARSKKATQPEPAPTTAEEVLALFTDQIVDLDLFTQGATAYTLTDAAGNERTYELPNDPPFPLVLAFQRAHDRYYRAMVELAGSKNAKVADVLLDKVQAAWSDLIGRKAEDDKPERPGAFLELVRIRKPEATVVELLDEIGASYTQNWMETVVMRLQLARLAGESNSALALLASALKESSGSPKANGGASSRSSGDSVG